MKFKLNPSLIIDTEENPWKNEGLRICLFGGPGSGKSSTATLIIEQFLTQGGTVVIFQPRDEYWTLKEKFDVICVGGVHSKDIDFLPSTPSAYAKAVVENGVSLIFYSSDVDDEEKLVQFTHRFLRYILKYQETQHRPILLVLEEAHEYAPLNAKGHIASPWVYNRMIKAFKDVFTQGRKLNVSSIAITQRPQELNFSIRQIANLSFYGKFSPQDISYIDRGCLKYYKNIPYSASDLRNLPTGKFVTITSETSFFTEVTEPRITKHGAETPTLKYIKPHKEQTKQAMHSLTEIITKALEKERRGKSELDKAKRQTKKLEGTITALTKKVDTLQTALEVAGRIKIETATSKPEVKSQMENLRNRAYNAEMKLSKIGQIIQGEESTIRRVHAKPSVDLYKVWESKMPSPCARNVFKFLLTNTSVKFTKGEIATKCGYAQSGSFNSALSFLKRNNLITTDGKLFWT